MFARSFRVLLKSQRLTEFTQIIDRKVIPLPQRQPGFQDAIAFSVPDGHEARGISLWNERENAGSYGREMHPEVIRVLWRVLEGTQKYEVVSSSFHRITTAVAT